MKCPKCGSTQNRTYDTRYTDNDSKRRRRRECICGHRFTTIEILNEEYSKLSTDNRAKDYSDRMKRIAQIANEAPQFH